MALPVQYSILNYLGSHQFGNIIFEVFTYTYSEFDADHKNCLLFGTLEASKIVYEVLTFGVFWAKGKIPGDG